MRAHHQPRAAHGERVGEAPDHRGRCAGRKQVHQPVCKPDQPPLRAPRREHAMPRRRTQLGGPGLRSSVGARVAFSIRREKPPFRRRGGRQRHETEGVRTTDGLNSTCMLAWFACGPRLRAPVGTTAAPARARGPLGRRWHSSPGALTPSVPRWASDSSRQLGSVGRRRKDWCVDDTQSASGRASWLAGRGIGRRSGVYDACTASPLQQKNSGVSA